MTEDVRVTRSVVIPAREVELRFARSGGPGGRKVDTAATKVELRFDLEATTALTEPEKARVRARLGNRITADGVLVLQASEYRTQQRNREAALARLRNLLRDALRTRPARRPTRPSRAARRERLEDKRRRAEVKRLRRPPDLP